jgi:hypothetical protein
MLVPAYRKILERREGGVGPLSKAADACYNGSRQSDMDASQTRDYCVAKYATLCAARPDPSLRKGRLLGTTIKSDKVES